MFVEQENSRINQLVGLIVTMQTTLSAAAGPPPAAAVTSMAKLASESAQTPFTDFLSSFYSTVLGSDTTLVLLTTI